MIRTATPLRRPTRAAVASLVAIVCAAGFAAGTASARTPTTDDEKTFYYLGTMAAQSIKDFQLSKDEAAWVVQGLQDALDKTAMDLDAAVFGPKLQTIAEARYKVALENEKAASQEYLEKAGKEKGARVTESGLIYTETAAGSGTQPGPTDTVKVHYHGTLRDGIVFDSSVMRGEPAEFPLNRVIPCWTEGVSMMKIGGKAKLVCPPEIAYGDRGAPPMVPAGAALSFDVELLEIVSE